MSKEITTWFAMAALAGLSIAVSSPAAVVAQPPGRGPGGPGRGGPPNVAEMFSRMDRNNDGKLTKDEVPGPVWDRMSNADADGDGGVTKDEVTKAMSRRRPDDGRPDGPPNDRSREDPSRGRGPRPPMEQGRGESPRGDARGQRDATPERGRPAPPRSPNQPDRDRSSRPDTAHRGPAPFGPDAFFDRLDKNHDGSLSRDEFKAVAELHRGPQASRGPGGPPIADRGPGMRSGGPPGARGERGNSFGPHRFQGGPPWARPGYGRPFHGHFVGPPWARVTHLQHHGSHHRAAHRGPRHRDGESRESRSRDHERSHSRRPHNRDRSDANSPRSDAEITTDESQSASPSDSVTSARRAKTAKAATLPL